MKLFQVQVEDDADLGNYLVKADTLEEAIVFAKQDEDIIRHMPAEVEFEAYEVLFKDTGVQDVAAECNAASSTM